MGSVLTRCYHKINVTPDCIKGCIRPHGHVESHVWVEAENRSDGLPMLIKWDINPLDVRRFEYTPILEASADE